MTGIDRWSGKPSLLNSLQVNKPNIDTNSAQYVINKVS